MKPTTKLASKGPRTHEGGRAAVLSDEQTLRRSVASCLLWEDTFYEEGESVHDRIISLSQRVKPETVAALAVEARTRMKLRHVPLLLCRELARLERLEPETLAGCLQRADEPGQFLALLFDGGKHYVPRAVRKGIRLALNKWDEYGFAKWGRQDFPLRDVLRLIRSKPSSLEQSELWRKAVKGELDSPDTWEVALSAAGKEGDKKAVWTRLLEEKRLPAMALLRNLRNMHEAGIEKDKVKMALTSTNFSKVLPFRFLAAARVVPQWEDMIDAAMLTLKPERILSGKTVLVVDISGSMDIALSQKSDMTRMDAACGLAVLAREACEEVDVYAFSNDCKLIPARRGMALRDAIIGSMPHDGTYLAGALAKAEMGSQGADRLLVITDEQAHDNVNAGFARHNYMMNVATYQHGVGRGRWVRIDGFSEAMLDFIAENESLTDTPQ